MKLLAYLPIMFLALGCESEKSQPSSEQDQNTDTEYPAKVVKLLSMIEKLEPGTDELTWLDQVDEEIGLPEDEEILDGGGGLGRSWLTIGIGAGDEWALSVESLLTNAHDLENADDFNDRKIWEARVIRTSISKALANEPYEVETIFPYYLKGHLMWKETRPGDVTEKPANKAEMATPRKPSD
jgi:hypothetical protein